METWSLLSCHVGTHTVIREGYVSNEPLSLDSFPISSSSVTVIRTLVKSNWGEERGDFGSHFQLIIWLLPTAGSLRESVAIGSFSSPILLIWLFLSVIFVNGLAISPIHKEPAPVSLFFVSFHFSFINFCSGLNGIFTSADLCLDCSFSGH